MVICKRRHTRAGQTVRPAGWARHGCLQAHGQGSRTGCWACRLVRGRLHAGLLAGGMCDCACTCACSTQQARAACPRLLTCGSALPRLVDPARERHQLGEDIQVGHHRPASGIETRHFRVGARWGRARGHGSTRPHTRQCCTPVPPPCCSTQRPTQPHSPLGGDGIHQGRGAVAHAHKPVAAVGSHGARRRYPRRSAGAAVLPGVWNEGLWHNEAGSRVSEDLVCSREAGSAAEKWSGWGAGDEQRSRAYATGLSRPHSRLHVPPCSPTRGIPR